MRADKKCSARIRYFCTLDPSNSLERNETSRRRKLFLHRRLSKPLELPRPNNYSGRLQSPKEGNEGRFLLAVQLQACHKIKKFDRVFEREQASVM